MKFYSRSRQQGLKTKPQLLRASSLNGGCCVYLSQPSCHQAGCKLCEHISNSDGHAVNRVRAHHAQVMLPWSVFLCLLDRTDRWRSREVIVITTPKLGVPWQQCRPCQGHRILWNRHPCRLLAGQPAHAHRSQTRLWGSKTCCWR